MTAMLNPADSGFLSALEARLPKGTLREVTPSYLEEPRGRYRGQAAAVARPGSVAEVSTILAAAHAARVPVIPYGGGTGLVGGQIAEAGPMPLLLSLERMNRVRDVDGPGNSIVVEAGMILADVQAAAERVDRLFPLSLASEGSCRIGGNLAANAGGINVIRYGNTRDLCLGLEAVFADGTVMHGLKRLRKDNTGYDLRHLLIGSEGTLGVITAASLRLFPRPTETATAMIAMRDVEAALSLLDRTRDAVGEAISAFELIHRQGLDFLTEKMPDVPQPLALEGEWIVLTELGGRGVSAALEKVLEAAFEAGEVTDAVIAQNAAQAQTLWDVRETIPEANRLVGGISSHDISLPVSDIPRFIGEAQAALTAFDPDLRINCFGHLGDGNLHYNVYPPKGRAKQEYDNAYDRIKTIVHDLTHAYDGSVSAEHGIGRLKTGDLETYGDPGKLMAMRAIKSALDPHGILNPGVILR
ncbi:FAD/FMN-containing dehydrogenase [Rubricella aquisinus]|uniref:FAD/FMN-containing dehydrogenase n=1 Tax=Rubricella aquisinus TaxID=2028108 RepID=A0A840WX98_9RHOB|nr:FAD-binding oxidoreductase [Rubricella aquisinus]MBB5514305.1 FAD/FMN-containing dehydrogenase [Rubricella aquisinus]